MSVNINSKFARKGWGQGVNAKNGMFLKCDLYWTNHRHGHKTSMFGLAWMHSVSTACRRAGGRVAVNHGGLPAQPCLSTDAEGGRSGWLAGDCFWMPHSTLHASYVKLLTTRSGCPAASATSRQGQGQGQRSLTALSLSCIFKCFFAFRRRRFTSVVNKSNHWSERKQFLTENNFFFKAVQSSGTKMFPPCVEVTEMTFFKSLFYFIYNILYFSSKGQPSILQFSDSTMHQSIPPQKLPFSVMTDSLYVHKTELFLYTN